jgi:nucleoside-triphosphatase THEP1
MSEIIIQYQNANQSYQDVIENFVIRKKEFERVIKELRNTSKEDSYQHFVFVGRRGSGKSTLLRRIEAEINMNKDLSANYVSVNLSEEQTGIYKLFDLWAYVIRDLNSQNYNIAEVDFRTYKNDLNAYSRVLHLQIIEALRKADKRLVLLVDNIDRVLKKADEATALLRELLMNFKEIRIIGGSTVMSEHFWKYDMPFYQFFSIKRLEALSLIDIETLLNHWAKILGITEIENIIKTNPGKIQSIRMLTDGSPRTMLLFVNMLLNRTQQNGYQYLQKIVDNATPIYQERLGILSPAQAKVISELAFLWDATSVEQLIQKCSMEGKVISALLAQLVSLRFVEKLNTETKNNLYRIEERFFNLWFNMTQGGPKQRYEAKALTEFLETWYNQTELREIALEFSKTLKEGISKTDYAESMSHALIGSLVLEPNVRQDLLLGLTKYVPNAPFKLVKDVFADFDLAVEEAFKSEEYQKVVEILKLSDIPEDKRNFGLGLAYQNLQNHELAEKYYLLAIEKGDEYSYHNLLMLYYKSTFKSKIKVLFKNKLKEEWAKKNLENFMIFLLYLGEIAEFNILYNQFSKSGNNLIFTSNFLINLLIHQQSQLVLTYFKKNEKAMEEYKPLWYVVLSLIKDKDLNKMPPELNEIVNDILSFIKIEQSKFYPPIAEY